MPSASRPIKFRVWYPEARQFDNAKFVVPESIMVWADGGGHSEWQQYTGLTDKHGVEIYEGDIVRSHGNAHVIIWDNETAGYRTRSVSSASVQMSLGQWINEAVPINDLEVIGNIYENPELLDGKEAA